MNPEDRKWLANVSALWPRGDVGEMLDKTGDTRISTRARLSPQAAALSREIVGRLPASTRWCHGGHAGRVVGERLVSGRGSRWIPADAVGGPGEAYVWFTTSRSAAVGYTLAVRGHVYEVEPRGEIEVDPEHLATFIKLGEWIDAYRSASEVVVARVLE